MAILNNIMCNSSAGNKQNIFSRRLMAAVMAVLYILVVFSPVASLSIHPASTAHATEIECSGDCNICGCSLESRTNKTCCCSKKREQQMHAPENSEADTPDCCRKASVPQKQVIISCGCPCGGGKQSVMSTAGSLEVLPFHFTENLIIPHSETSFSPHTNRLTSRHGEPPDPPPKLSIRS
jgi:hypothetical protein